MQPVTVEVLVERFRAMSRPVLLGLDIDGTLSPIADEPRKAVLAHGAASALTLVNSLPDVRLVLFTGRGADDARRHFAIDPEISIIGDHGAEVVGGATIDPGVIAEIIEQSHVHPAVRVENKEFSVAVHFRLAPRVAAQRVAELLTDLARAHGLHLLHGKSVIELSRTYLSKGRVVGRVSRHVGASSIVYVGDDLTDETVFGVLRSTDMGIKVGSGGSIAQFQLDSVDQVIGFLRALYRAESYL